MFERIKNAICHPKHLGAYIIDKTYIIISILAVFFLILTTTIFFINKNDTYLTSEEATKVKNVLLSDNALIYDNNQLYFEVDKEYTIFNLTLSVDKDGVIENKEGLSLILMPDRVKVLNNKKILKEQLYTDFPTLTFNYLLDKEHSDIYFEIFITEAFKLTYSYVYISSTIFDCIEVIFSALLLALLIFFLTGRLNRQVKGIFRIRLLLYSFISYLFIYWFYFVFDRNTFAYILTFIIPYLYFFISLINILAIKKVSK